MSRHPPVNCGLRELFLNSRAEIAAEMVSSSLQPQLPISNNRQHWCLVGLTRCVRSGQRGRVTQPDVTNAALPSSEALGGTERKDGCGRMVKRRKINPRSPLAHLLWVSARCWLSGGAGVRGSAGRHGVQMLPRPPPTSMETAGPNICSHLYKTPGCLAAHSLLRDPLKLLRNHIASPPSCCCESEELECGCSTMTTQTTALAFSASLSSSSERAA